MSLRGVALRNACGTTENVLRNKTSAESESPLIGLYGPYHYRNRKVKMTVWYEQIGHLGEKSHTGNGMRHARFLAENPVYRRRVPNQGFGEHLVGANRPGTTSRFLLADLNAHPATRAEHGYCPSPWPHRNQQLRS